MKIINNIIRTITCKVTTEASAIKPIAEEIPTDQPTTSISIRDTPSEISDSESSIVEKEEDTPSTHLKKKWKTIGEIDDLDGQSGGTISFEEFIPEIEMESGSTYDSLETHSTSAEYTEPTVQQQKTIPPREYDNFSPDQGALTSNTTVPARDSGYVHEETTTTTSRAPSPPSSNTNNNRSVGKSVPDTAHLELTPVFIHLWVNCILEKKECRNSDIENILISYSPYESMIQHDLIYEVIRDFNLLACDHNPYMELERISIVELINPDDLIEAVQRCLFVPHHRPYSNLGLLNFAESSYVGNSNGY